MNYITDFFFLEPNRWMNIKKSNFVQYVCFMILIFRSGFPLAINRKSKNVHNQVDMLNKTHNTFLF